MEGLLCTAQRQGKQGVLWILRVSCALLLHRASPLESQSDHRLTASCALQGQRILPLLFQCLEDDYYEATRLNACSAIAVLGSMLDTLPAQATPRIFTGSVLQGHTRTC